PPQYPPPPAQPFAGMPPQYPPPPGQPFSGMPPQFPPPIIMGAPPGTPTAGKNPLTWVIVGAVIFGLWYIGTHDKDNDQNPGGAPTTQTQPGPGGGGGGDQNQAIIATQKFSGSYTESNGEVEVVQGRWQNGSNVAVASVTLACEQMDANGQNLAQSTKTLDGPAPPGAIQNVPTFSIGAAAQGVAKANCAITGAQTQN
ncbi:MAG: hypothetical protein WBP90_13320, partial [Terracidiphilus sp.]